MMVALQSNLSLVLTARLRRPAAQFFVMSKTTKLVLAFISALLIPIIPGANACLCGLSDEEDVNESSDIVVVTVTGVEKKIAKLKNKAEVPLPAISYKVSSTLKGNGNLNGEFFFLGTTHCGRPFTPGSSYLIFLRSPELKILGFCSAIPIEGNEDYVDRIRKIIERSQSHNR